eukprot:769707-Prymnesium_polylepis.2
MGGAYAVARAGRGAVRGSACRSAMRVVASGRELSTSCSGVVMPSTSARSTSAPCTAGRSVREGREAASCGTRPRTMYHVPCCCACT